MLSHRNKNGKPYSPIYLKILHNQFSTVFNHTVKHYRLAADSAALIGNIGKARSGEMQFQAKEEYQKFAQTVMDKSLSFYALEILYWCGIREGELLALISEDFDFEEGTVTINKSHQRIKGRDTVTESKTPKSNRVIQTPVFLGEEIQEYIKTPYGIKLTNRIFPVMKSYLYRGTVRGVKTAGAKKVRIHDPRHSYISLLIGMGFTAPAIADRVGHESTDITY